MFSHSFPFTFRYLIYTPILLFYSDLVIYILSPHIYIQSFYLYTASFIVSQFYYCSRKKTYQLRDKGLTI